MKREIKFRVWHDRYTEMYFTEHANYETKRELYPFEFAIGFSYFNVNDLSELMQYTGLKDKNGKEIYEGDILKYHEDTICVIEWTNEGGFVGHILHIIKGEFSENWWDIAEIYSQPNKFEIIGNIHQNKDLIK